MEPGLPTVLLVTTKYVVIAAAICAPKISKLITDGPRRVNFLNPEFDRSNFDRSSASGWLTYRELPILGPGTILEHLNYSINCILLWQIKYCPNIDSNLRHCCPHVTNFSLSTVYYNNSCAVYYSCIYNKQIAIRNIFGISFEVFRQTT